MVGVFIVFVVFGVPTIQAAGLGAAVAVAVSAMLVQLAFMPSLIILLGERMWWTPALARPAAAARRARLARAGLGRAIGRLPGAAPARQVTTFTFRKIGPVWEQALNGKGMTFDAVWFGG